MTHGQSRSCALVIPCTLYSEDPDVQLIRMMSNDFVEDRQVACRAGAGAVQRSSARSTIKQLGRVGKASSRSVRPTDVGPSESFSAGNETVVRLESIRFKHFGEPFENNVAVPFMALLKGRLSTGQEPNRHCRRCVIFGDTLQHDTGMYFWKFPNLGHRLKGRNSISFHRTVRGLSGRRRRWVNQEFPGC